VPRVLPDGQSWSRGRTGARPRKTAQPNAEEDPRLWRDLYDAHAAKAAAASTTGMRRWTARRRDLPGNKKGAMSGTREGDAAIAEHFAPETSACARWREIPWMRTMAQNRRRRMIHYSGENGARSAKT